MKRKYLATLAITSFSGISSLFSQVINVENRLELFSDDYLIESLTGDARQILHQPEAKEVVLIHDVPWEHDGAYYTVFQDGDTYKMYYRGIGQPQATPSNGASAESQNTKPKKVTEVTCIAESKDGIHWVRPQVGLYDWEGSNKNNIVWMGDSAAHNFSVFKDQNPKTQPNALYKAIGQKRGPRAYESPDGLKWTLMSDQALVTDGTFDSQNVAFWDTYRQEYRMYWRTNPHMPGGFQSRSISTATSKDFLTWGTPKPLQYPGKEEPKELWDMQLYTSCILPYFRAPHIFIGFPTQVKRRYESLPLFMSSRDGVNFNRWDEPVIPSSAPQDRQGNRSNFMAWGLLYLPGKPDEMSVYAQENNRAETPSRLRRFAYRLDGFVSITANESGGEILTKALLFAGKHLIINCKAQPGGSLQVEIQDENGSVLEGFSAEDCEPLTGDNVKAVVRWKGNSDLSGAPSQEAIRLRFILKNAELFSIQFQ